MSKKSHSTPLSCCPLVNCTVDNKRKVLSCDRRTGEKGLEMNFTQVDLKVPMLSQFEAVFKFADHFSAISVSKAAELAR